MILNILPVESRLRPPKQDRSQETLDRISTAALELMAERGVEGATIASIVARAEASVGSFYARFPSKDDLVRYLRDRVWTEARERWDQALTAESWSGRSTREVVEGVVGLLLHSLRSDYHRRRVLGREPPGDREAEALRSDFHNHILDAVIPLLMVRREDIDHPDPEEAIRFGYRFVVGAIREFLELEEPAGGMELGPELARAWMGYLTSGSGKGGREEEAAVDFFDPWG